MLQLHLPAHAGHKLLKGLAAAGVGEDADLVLLALRHVDDGDLVRLAALLIVQVLQFTHCNTETEVRNQTRGRFMKAVMREISCDSQ